MKKERVFKDRSSCAHLSYGKYSHDTVERINLILGNFSYKRIDHVLDIGCGYGELLKSFATCKAKVGVDIDLSILTDIDRADGITVCVAEGERLPFKDNSFDLVTAILILEHALAPLNLLKEARRVSREYGIFATPNVGRPHRLIAAMRGQLVRDVSGHLQGWDYHLFRQFLEINGWEIVKFKTRFVDVPFYNLLPTKLVRWLSYGALLKLFPRAGSEMFAFCRKKSM